jgi:hypothetical protein
MRSGGKASMFGDLEKTTMILPQGAQNINYKQYRLEVLRQVHYRYRS